MKRLAAFSLLLFVPLFGGRPVLKSSREFEQARQLYDDRHYSEARRIFQELVALDPDDLDLNFYLGRLALWFDDAKAALAHLERAQELAPADARVQNALGDAYGLMATTASFLAKFDYARKCKAAYERAVTLDPRNPAYHWSLIGYYHLAPRLVGGGVDKGYAEVAELRRLDPMSGRIAYATLCLTEKKYAEAFGQFDEVLRQSPDDFMALYHIGRCAAISGEQLERGLAALRRCLGLVPPEGDGKPTVASTHFRLGNIYEKMGDRVAARREYDAAMAANPDFRPEKVGLKN